jgi:hypothetical protein
LPWAECEVEEVLDEGVDLGRACLGDSQAALAAAVAPEDLLVDVLEKALAATSRWAIGMSAVNTSRLRASLRILGQSAIWGRLTRQSPWPATQIWRGGERAAGCTGDFMRAVRSAPGVKRRSPCRIRLGHASVSWKEVRRESQPKRRESGIAVGSGGVPPALPLPASPTVYLHDREGKRSATVSPSGTREAHPNPALPRRGRGSFLAVSLFPMTEIPKSYEPRDVEKKWYAAWQSAGCFRGQPVAGRENYTIVIPPPNVTGILHMGHVLNNTLQDTIIRRARLEGKTACWIPGTDHAGIATQTMVEKHLRKTEKKTRRDLGREEFLKRVWEWARNRATPSSSSSANSAAPATGNAPTSP